MPIPIQTINLKANQKYEAKEFVSSEDGQPTGEALNNMTIMVFPASETGDPANVLVENTDESDNSAFVTPLNFPADVTSAPVGSDSQWDAVTPDGVAVRALVHINNLHPDAPEPVNGAIVFTPVGP